MSLSAGVIRIRRYITASAGLIGSNRKNISGHDLRDWHESSGIIPA